MQEQFVAVKAIIYFQNKILLLREPEDQKKANPGHWDVPGGRVSLGEQPLDALRREIREETGLTVEVEYPVFISDWRPVIDGLPRHIVGMYIACRAHGEGPITLDEEHDEYRWVSPAEAKALPLMSSVKNAVAAFDALQQRLLK